MPIYEYACTECGEHLEARQKFSDPPLTDCPSCGNAALERLISESSFALKGAGWYADGYGPSKGDKKSESSTASESKKDDKKAETKTDAKPDAKPEKKAEKKASSAA